MPTTNKVQIDNTATSTSTGNSYTVSSPPKTERGWECPRCGRINAPWKSYCDCAGGYWYPTLYPWYYKEPWWRQVYCDSDTFKVHPETTTWKAPSSVCSSDSSTCKANGVTTAWSSNSAMDTGGSDYWNSITRNWENVPHTLTNMQKDLDEIKATFNSTLRGE